MRLRALVTVGVLVAMAGCTPDWAKQNDSTLLMQITKVVGVANSSNAPSSGDVLYSDVGGTIINDDATLTVTLMRKDPNGVSSPTEDVILDHYEVQYTRTDGHNIEGQDVPFRITGPMNATISAPAGNSTSATDAVITVVRQQAKVEPPLRNLRDLTIDPSTLLVNSTVQFGGAGILTTIAHITVYGKSTNNHTLTATGQLQVTFANFSK